MGYLVTIKNPKTFNGLLACGGGLVTDALKGGDYKKAKKLKVIISHGKADTIVDPMEASKAYNVLKEKGFDVKLLEFDGGHSVSPAACRELLDRLQ